MFSERDGDDNALPPFLRLPLNLPGSVYGSPILVLTKVVNLCLLFFGGLTRTERLRPTSSLFLPISRDLSSYY